MKVLTWKVAKTIPTACPDYQPDPYTGEYPSFHCAVYHCETVTETKSAEFETTKEAQEFADKAPLSCYDFRLNGKLLKDKRQRPGSTTIDIRNNSNTFLSGGSGNPDHLLPAHFIK